MSFILPETFLQKCTFRWLFGRVKPSSLEQLKNGVRACISIQTWFGETEEFVQHDYVRPFPGRPGNA
ncbi:hypothetical protein EAS61_37090 [Bradyrhizobium zhanjiangense]|uniref:Uncharacterized protein n=1 Tax=Bradyrhizobium zhanjiangense TaxID=1325107 RepID=A0A4Q0Q8E3_9BRAD|nr:hypothetical protein EAS61_37090 [Bradyrhizobium zhanjiangense]